MVVLDTNIIIDHTRQTGQQDTVLMKIAQEVARENLAISVVSIQELYAGKSTLDRESQAYLVAIIAPLRVLAYTYEIAQYAGEIMRDLPRPIVFADAAIAATALVNEASLLTLNRKDFEGIKNLDLIQ